MDEAILSKMEPVQKAKIAVAYLAKNKEERPEGMDKAFSKLEQFEISMREIMTAMNEARQAIKELQVRADQMYGSMEGIVELIAEDLPEDKVNEWCAKYEPPTQIPPGMRPRPTRPEEKPDMAGSTAHLNPVEVPPGVKQ